MKSISFFRKITLFLVTLSSFCRGQQRFIIKSDKNLTCQREDSIDVNKGRSWSSFLQYAHCAVTGRSPSNQDLTPYYPSNNWRRIDVVKDLCTRAGRSSTCNLLFSDPWVNGDLRLTPVCNRKTNRDLGAVFMFFFRCPDKTNCDMNWANSHVYGMKQVHPFYDNGYYNGQTNPSFWKREFEDAVYAGLQFLLPNVYGPDLYQKPNVMKYINDALDSLHGKLKVGFFDDTWMWGKIYGAPLFNTLPNLSDVEGAAKRMYELKWQWYFRNIKREHWYLIKGRPLIYFYNAGTLKPASSVTPVLRRMKQLFVDEFGVEPFLALDRAFPALDVGDTVFRWNSFLEPAQLYIAPERPSQLGLKFAHFMPRWDSRGRDGPTSPNWSRFVKGPELLRTNLAKTADMDIVVIATWNDLGEGTSFNRNFDYYYNGKWLIPTYFMQITRANQCCN